LRQADDASRLRWAPSEDLRGTLRARTQAPFDRDHVLSPTAERVIIASSASAACALQGGDAGTGAPLNGAAIAFMADTCCTGASGAQLTVWKNGVVVIDAENATSGSVGESLNQPGTGGGTMGGYNLTFGSDVEEGSFVAPACDICAGGP